MPGLPSWIAGFFNRSSISTAKQGQDNNGSRSQGGAGQNSRSHTHNPLTETLHRHLFCWLLDTRPQTLIADEKDTEAMLKSISKNLRAGQLRELPRQPMSLPMLMSALSDDTTTRQDMGNIILRDPALTDQLLKVANSPFFRPDKNTIESVDQAIFMLGMEGIRNVVSAAIMRPMISARNREEALFTTRTWRWGMSCARTAETIAGLKGKNASIYFMAGLLPALAQITLYRETHRLMPADEDGNATKPKPATLHQILIRYQWPVARLIARTWGLSKRYQTLLHRPESRHGRDNSALTDGILIGTREILRYSRQRNLAEEDLPALVQLSAYEIARVRAALKPMLEDIQNAHAGRD